MSEHPVPRLDDIVVLNDHGLEQCFGTGWQSLKHMKTMKMKIISVDKHSLTYPEKTYVVEVDNQDINQFMIDHRCFDIVREEK